jgi:PIN domain nuclease of toxin-antitoxin system
VRLLLDTHVFYWWMAEHSRLSADAQRAISEPTNEVYVSVASAWELAIKVGAGKWPEAVDIVDQFEHHLAAESFRLLTISVAHVRSAGLMASAHRDPFDRLLAAQAGTEGLRIITVDAKLAALTSDVVW